MEPTETTLTGSRMWIVIGIVAFVCVLIVIGVYNQPARTYINDSVRTMLALIPVVK